MQNNVNEWNLNIQHSFNYFTVENTETKFASNYATSRLFQYPNNPNNMRYEHIETSNAVLLKHTLALVENISKCRFDLFRYFSL